MINGGPDARAIFRAICPDSFPPLSLGAGVRSAVSGKSSPFCDSRNVPPTPRFPHIDHVIARRPVGVHETFRRSTASPLRPQAAKKRIKSRIVLVERHVVVLVRRKMQDATAEQLLD